MPSPKVDTLCEFSGGEGGGHPLQVQRFEGDEDKVDIGPKVHCTLCAQRVMGCSHANIQPKASDLCSVHPEGQQDGVSQNKGAWLAWLQALGPTSQGQQVTLASSKGRTWVTQGLCVSQDGGLQRAGSASHLHHRVCVGRFQQHGQELGHVRVLGRPEETKSV